MTDAAIRQHKGCACDVKTLVVVSGLKKLGTEVVGAGVCSVLSGSKIMRLLEPK